MPKLTKLLLLVIVLEITSNLYTKNSSPSSAGTITCIVKGEMINLSQRNLFLLQEKGSNTCTDSKKPN